MNKKDQAKQEILVLIDKFAQQLDYYKKNKDYNEFKTRKDYIDPLFEALGWDLSNKKGQNESYREVILEDKLKIEGKTKAPDYCFRSNGNRKFFLEAKKPSFKIESDSAPAYQIRRYGWSAKLPISVLTDFEEFAIYDCSLKPEANDPASKARLKYIKFSDYEKEWDFIWDIFSKEQVLKGSLDQFAQIEKKGISNVDSEFLKSLDTWRMFLANDLIKQNADLDEESLNFALQKTLDRLVFLRICEDRGIEIYGKIRNCANQKHVYKHLLDYFSEADQKYNSGLFDFKKDSLSHKISIGNDVLEKIISQLYFPNCPYEFSVIPVEILGNAYEQFLGKQIKIDKGKQIKIDEKPEVRKAGGVYYTPQYIVDYIVKNTLGTKIAELESKNTISQRNGISIIDEISKLKICDPACGSGSFLLGAYQFLLDWHLDFYSKNSTFQKSGISKNVLSKLLTPDGTLTSSEKRRILLNNIYGVDIDINAVEVTKLSLLLKAMEGETTASINESLKMFHTRVLPTLENNIKSGNSLVDLDFYESQIDFEPEVEKKVKPFNWAQNFPEVFGKEKGFDIILGNPPYVRADLMLEEQRNYLCQTYRTFEKTADLYVFFMEKSLKILAKNGLYGIIVANKWLKAKYAKSLRELLQQKQIIEIVDFGDLPVFGKVAAYPCILLLQNKAVSVLSQTQNIPQKIQNLITDFETHRKESNLPKAFKESLHLGRESLQELENQVISYQKQKKSLNGLYASIQNIASEIDFLRKSLAEKIQFRATLVQELKELNLPNYVETNGFVVDQDILKSEGWNLQNNQIQNILSKIRQKGIPLGLYINDLAFRGLITGLNEAFVIDNESKEKMIKKDARSAELLKPFLAGKDLHKYQNLSIQRWLIFIPSGWTKRKIANQENSFEWFAQNYPAVAEHLLPFAEKAKKRFDKGDFWWELRKCAYYELFEKPKIMYQVMQVRNAFTFDTTGFYCNNSVWFIPSSDKYLLGLLNSKIGWFLISNYCTQIQNGYQLIFEYLEKMPIKTIDFENKTEKDLHDRIVKNVDTILSLHTQPKGYATDQRIQYLENQIDNWVMDLYSLTAEERELL